MKNPLGIIALFVTFIDGIAGLVISVNFENLHGASERLPLIWFIILFPIIVLFAFLYLVIKHPTKLYGPNDFNDQKMYLEVMGKNIRPHEKPELLEKPEKISLEKNKNSWSLFSYSRMKSPQSYMLIADAALQKYSDEHNLEIKTEVYSSCSRFDGIAEKEGTVYLFDVKINYSFSMVAKIKRSLEDFAKTLIRKGNDSIHIVLILVTKEKMQADEINKLQELLTCGKQNLEIVNYVSEDF